MTARRSGARSARRRWQRLGVCAAAAAAVVAAATTAQAQLVQAEPTAPIVAAFPAGEAPRETQVVLQIVVDETGRVESAVEISRLPREAGEAFVVAAIGAVKMARFAPSSRDGRPIRSRLEYVVAFVPPAPPPAAPPPAASPPPAPLPAVVPPVEDVLVRGGGWSSPRGLGDVRVDRETLTASPRQETSEMLSAAPGFFVDHEDGEGLGNDVYLRGFDVENGSGIEMRLGDVPINVPMHIRGQGYADVNFIIPEVVRSIRVLEGPYDPRQGDAAIAGSAYFDLAVPDRGYQVRATYGSFGQSRIVGVAAPKGASDETFAAFALRETQGFGEDRESKSASVNAQYGVDFGESDHLRVLVTGYASSAALPGVVRQDDVTAGRIGYDDAYPYFNTTLPAGCAPLAPCARPAQGVDAARVIAGAELDHAAGGGAVFAVSPWVMWTDFRSRQNYTGDLLSSNLQPGLGSLGDLWQLANVETAWGATARFHTAPFRVGEALEIVVEPGVVLRAGHTDQSKDLLNPANLSPWDERESFGLNTIDAAGYVDVDARLWKRLRVSGGVRADFLDVSIDDRLAGVSPPVAGELAGRTTNVAGVAPGPRLTVAYEGDLRLVPVVSAGEGFRSLDAGALTRCNAAAIVVPSASTLAPCSVGLPYSRVVSVEVGVRSEAARGRYVTTLTAFQTNVGNELVFEPESGGLVSEGPSTRRGIVASVLARPTPWLLASAALTLQTATFDTLVVGTSHDVPNVPAFLLRADVNAHGDVLRLGGAPITGRIGVGYTLLGGRHVNDAIIAPTNHVLNALASLRYRVVEVGVDVFNVLGLQYPDDEAYFVSNWSLRPGQNPASAAVHIVAAPPRTVLGTLGLSF